MSDLLNNYIAYIFGLKDLPKTTIEAESEEE